MKWDDKFYKLIHKQVIRKVNRMRLKHHMTLNTICSVLLMEFDPMKPKKNSLIAKKKKNQCRAIRHEFEPVGPTLFKNSLGVGWGLLPTL